MKEISYNDAIERMAFFGQNDVQIAVWQDAKTYTIPELYQMAHEGSAKFYVPEEVLEPKPIEPEKKIEAPIGLKTPEQDAAPEKPKRDLHFDHKKVLALRNAGWSLAKIADEMGCNVKKVQNSLYRHKEEKEMEVKA